MTDAQTCEVGGNSSTMTPLPMILYNDVMISLPMMASSSIHIYNSRTDESIFMQFGMDIMSLEATTKL
jgi:hypothetical protein